MRRRRDAKRRLGALGALLGKVAPAKPLGDGFCARCGEPLTSYGELVEHTASAHPEYRKQMEIDAAWAIRDIRRSRPQGGGRAP